MSDRSGPWIQTYTGRRYWLVEPRPADIEPADIAWSLANLCRYGGHTQHFYSVAEHSLLLAAVVEPELKLAALLHDAPEAYLGDVTQPLKRLLTDYALLEAKAWRAIAERFGLAETLPAAVKLADRRIMADERRQVLTDEGEGAQWDWEPGPPLGVRVRALSPQMAAFEFIDTLYRLIRAQGART